MAWKHNRDELIKILLKAQTEEEYHRILKMIVLAVLDVMLPNQ